MKDHRFRLGQEEVDPAVRLPMCFHLTIMAPAAEAPPEGTHIMQIRAFRQPRQGYCPAKVRRLV